MRTLNPLHLSGRLVVGAALLLAVSPLNVYAQKDKDREKSKPAPSHSAPSHQSAPPSRPTPQTHTAPPPSRPAPEAAPSHATPPPNQTHTPSAPTGNTPPNANAGRTFGNPRPGGATPNAATPNAATPGGRTPGNNVPNAGNTRPGNATPGNLNNTRPGMNTPPRAVGGNTPGATNNTRPGMTPPPGGRQFGTNGNPNRGSAITRTPNGGMVTRASDGRVREVRTPGGAVIRHAPTGVRQVQVVRPNGRVVVATGRGGYVQRPMVVGGRTYVQRTYIVSGRPVVRVYNPYRWGGLTVNIYRPVAYYPAPYYAWAYNPWARPIHWGWGWGIGTPWFGFYGGWFTPYPVYASPSLWLTDYMIAMTLQEAYNERMAAQAAQAQASANANYAQTPLTPDVKQAIADEVKRQLDQERSEQQNANYQPTLFGGGGTHVFVVANALDVQSNTGECALTEGDVVQLNSAPPQGAESAQVVVMASKGNDCRKGSMANVGVADLQEMQNHMRETLDQGLGELRSKQGQGEMPALPPAAAAPVTQASYAAELQQPDPSANTEISQVNQEASRSEQDVVSQSTASSGGAAPVTIALGQTTDEVVAMLGQPTKTADLGSRQIYIYRDMKITFTDGKVTDVQ